MSTDLIGPANAPNSVTSRPTDTRSFGSLDTWFKDCTSSAANDGTKLQAGFMNAVLGQVRNFIRGNGLTAASALVTAEDNTDGMLLASAQNLIQRGLTNYAVDTGTANALAASLSPTPAELKSGLVVHIKKSAAANGSGGVTLALNGNPAKPVLRMDGSTLKALDLPANLPFQAQYDGTLDAFMVTNFQPAQLALTANRTIYVNGAIGNDANDGVSNTSGHALATIQAAINLAFDYAPSQYTITIIIEAGTYTAGGRTPLYPGPNLLIDGLNSANALVTPTNDYGFLIQGPNTAIVQNVKVTSTVSALGAACFAAFDGATLTTHNTASGATNGPVFNAAASGTLLTGDHTFSGSCAACWWASALGTVGLLQSSTYTFSTALTVADATAWASGCGTVGVSASSPVTFVNPGNVTGAKYLATANGVVNANAQGINFFPGSSAGSTNTGGQYV